MKRPVGRPPTKGALTKEGQQFTLLLEKKQWEFLDDISSKTGIAKAELVRKLIQDEMNSWE